jgi:hypothetical protein
MTLASRATLLLLTGIALGPRGLALLSVDAIEVLGPAVPVALALLGVSAVLGSPAHDGRSRRDGRFASLIILAAGVAMALHQRNVIDAAAIVGQVACMAALLAIAGWMLSSRGASDEERRVFSIAIFLLLGGVADYLSVSGLLLGSIAAIAWQLVQTKEASEVRLDAAYVQHPMTALLLITAGAQVRLSWQVALFAAAAATLATAFLLLLRHRPVNGALFGGIPLTPATFAVALAIDAARLDPQLTPLLSIVVLAASLFDVASRRLTEEAA